MSDNLKKTRSYTYLLPELATKIKIDKEKIKNLFLGVKDKTKTFNGNVYLWVDIDTKYEKIDYWVSSNIYNNNLILEYQYPNIYTYTKFIKSRYSEFKEKTKKEILNYHHLPISNKIGKILYKSSELRKEMEIEFGVPINGELGEEIKFENEIYNINE